MLADLALMDAALMAWLVMLVAWLTVSRQRSVAPCTKSFHKLLPPAPAAALTRRLPRTRQSAFGPVCRATRSSKPILQPRAAAQATVCAHSPNNSSSPNISSNDSNRRDRPVHTVIMSTSVAPWMLPGQNGEYCFDTAFHALSSLLQSPALAGAQLLVVADAVPTEAERQVLPAVDADKWSNLWDTAHTPYAEQYLPALRRWIDASGYAGRVGLIELIEFGHLVGTVRAGLEACGAGDDDVVLFTQHDLALSGQLFDRECAIQLSHALGRPDCGIEYVLLNRDQNDAPRSVGWLEPAPATDAALFPRPPTGSVSSEGTIELPQLCDVGGRFADQTHLARAGWYRDHVLARCGQHKTCMEHALHQFHGGGEGFDANHGGDLNGATFLLGGPSAPPAIKDLVHGSQLPIEAALRLLGHRTNAAFQPFASAEKGGWQADAWPVVLWDPCNPTQARAALSHRGSDASKRADGMALPAASHAA